MKKVSLAVLLLAFVPATNWPQEQPPQLLVHAAHCLAVKDFLPSSRAKTLSFGYFLDEKSYPGEKVLYAVNFASPARSKGLVFAIFLSRDDDHQVFNIQNNASFVLSREDVRGVSFVNPPLGGGWTQEHLASAIQKIEKQPRLTIAVKDFLASDASIRCESYTDPQK
jgi:hypothetical protein